MQNRFLNCSHARRGCNKDPNGEYRDTRSRAGGERSETKTKQRKTFRRERFDASVLKCHTTLESRIIRIMLIDRRYPIKNAYKPTHTFGVASCLAARSSKYTQCINFITQEKKILKY